MSEKKQRIVKQERILNNTPMGLNNNFVIEEFAKPRTTNSQNLIKGQNNSYISFGRDKNAGGASGAGGRGFTQCGAIDLVAGLDSSNALHEEEREPNFFTDASRMYITQKGKVDSYFGLAKGSRDGDEKWSAGIGIKSDKVNIIGRNHIKIVTGKARINTDEKTAAGGSYSGAGKIDLIAGNFTGKEKPKSIPILGNLLGPTEKKVLQPIPKGDNLVELLKEILFDSVKITTVPTTNEPETG